MIDPFGDLAGRHFPGCFIYRKYLLHTCMAISSVPPDRDVCLYSRIFKNAGSGFSPE